MERDMAAAIKGSIGRQAIGWRRSTLTLAILASLLSPSAHAAMPKADSPALAPSVKDPVCRARVKAFDKHYVGAPGIDMLNQLESYWRDCSLELGANHPDTLAMQLVVARAYSAAGQLKKAYDLTDQVWSSRVRSLGERAADTLSVEVSRTNQRVQLGLIPKDAVFGTYQALLTRVQDALGEQTPLVWDLKVRLVQEHLARRELAQAQSLALSVLEQAERIYGTESMQVSSVLAIVAAVRYEQGQRDEAFKQAARGYEITRKLLGVDHPGTIDSLRAHAWATFAMGYYGQAEPLYERLAALSAQAYGPTHGQVLAAEERLARARALSGRFETAEPLFVKLERHAAAVQGQGSEEHVAALTGLGIFYALQGNEAAALPVVDRLLAVADSADNVRMGAALNAIAQMANEFYQKGLVDAATQVLQSVIAYRARSPAVWGATQFSWQQRQLSYLRNSGRYVDYRRGVERALSAIPTRSAQSIDRSFMRYRQAEADFLLGEAPQARATLSELKFEPPIPPAVQRTMSMQRELLQALAELATAGTPAATSGTDAAQQLEAALTHAASSISGLSGSEWQGAVSNTLPLNVLGLTTAIKRQDFENAWLFNALMNRGPANAPIPANAAKPQTAADAYARALGLALPSLAAARQALGVGEQFLSLQILYRDASFLTFDRDQVLAAQTLNAPNQMGLTLAASFGLYTLKPESIRASATEDAPPLTALPGRMIALPEGGYQWLWPGQLGQAPGQVAATDLGSARLLLDRFWRKTLLESLPSLPKSTRKVLLHLGPGLKGLPLKRLLAEHWPGVEVEEVDLKGVAQDKP